MAEVTLTVTHKIGLHARPAAEFVKTARQFPCSIKITFGERSVNAKSILNVLSLGVNMGAVITIQADGQGADEAVAALTDLIKSNFGGIE